MRCGIDEDVPKIGGGKEMKKIYRGFEYIDFYCDAVNECTDVEVIVEEIPDA